MYSKKTKKNLKLSLPKVDLLMKLSIIPLFVIKSAKVKSLILKEIKYQDFVSPLLFFFLLN